MKVTKRDGRLEELDITNIRKQTIPACEGLDGVSYEDLELSAQILFTDGIKTSQIQESLIQTAMDKIDIDKPNWTYVAARLSLYDLYHRIKAIYGKDVPGDVYKHVSLQDYIDRNQHLLSDWYTKYTKEEIEELNNEIVSSRDLLFTLPAMLTVENRYLLVDTDQVVELPQHMFMSIAMFVAQNEKDKMYWAKKFYEKTSLLKFISATPINANGRKKDSATASCLVHSMGDTLDSIMETLNDLAQGSKLGAGHGVDTSRLRAASAPLRGIKNRATGIIPIMKLHNDIALAINQLGVRQGAITDTLEVWHADIFDFIDLRKRQGEERRRAQDLFLAVSIPSIFIDRIKKNGVWTLFDPYDVPGLTETFGEEFKKLYEKYEDEFINNKRDFNPYTRQIPIQEIVNKLIYSWTTEGLPFWFFKDNANKAHKYHKELGIVRSSNLCQELIQPVNTHETAVCNLGSLNISTLKDEKDIIETSQVAVRFLDNVIDVTDYSTEKAKRTQLARRSIGIGYLGEAEYLAVNHIHYGSKEHEEWLHKFYSLSTSAINNYSIDLAKEKGGCDVDPSIRNAYRMCIAPNTASGLLAGTTPSHEPLYARVYTENSKIGSYKITAPHISIDNIEYYKNAFEIPHMDQIRMLAARQQYIDMAISNSLYEEDVSKISAIDILKVIVKAHDLGVKTLYYFRTKAKKTKEIENVIQAKAIVCEGCEN
jgi:ribonucleoside-diphosphate reductase, alpha subunit|nr:MAG TPA: ribonucleotide-diphosphate reductase subunit alpha [Caudoviricetes sp.]